MNRSSTVPGVNEDRIFGARASELNFLPPSVYIGSAGSTATTSAQDIRDKGRQRRRAGTTTIMRTCWRPVCLQGSTTDCLVPGGGIRRFGEVPAVTIHRHRLNRGGGVDGQPRRGRPGERRRVLLEASERTPMVCEWGGEVVVHGYQRFHRKVRRTCPFGPPPGTSVHAARGGASNRDHAG